MKHILNHKGMGTMKETICIPCLPSEMHVSAVKDDITGLTFVVPV
jgi:hypothetical protein